MTPWIGLSEEQILSVAIPAGVAVLVTLLALLVRGVLYGQLHKWTARTKSELDDMVVHSTRGPSLFWCFVLGLYVALQVAELPDAWVDLAGKIIAGLLILSLTLVAANMAGGLIRVSSARAQLALPITGLTQNVVKIVIIILGLFILLETFGVKVTSLLAALGIGSLAIALALQDTLSNIFAGAHITMGKDIRVGDYIKLDSGDEGYVVDIGWRATRIRTLPNNIVIVPNSKLAQAIVTNYCLPEPRMSLLIPIGVSYDTDPDHVERVLVEEAKGAVGQVPGLLGEPAPFVRFIPGFGDYSLNFTLICQVKEFVDQYQVQHELRKRILNRFKKEGIEIPFPTRTIYTRGGPGDVSQRKSA